METESEKIERYKQTLALEERLCRDIESEIAANPDNSEMKGALRTTRELCAFLRAQIDKMQGTPNAHGT